MTDANRPLYRELAAARIMDPTSTRVGGPESAFHFTRASWERWEERVKVARAARRASRALGR